MSGSRPDKDAAAPADPVASLFSADRTMPAPVVAPEINESELTRWKSARDSLFGDGVKDAAAPPLETAEPVRPKRVGASAATPGGGGMPGVRTLAVAKVGDGDALETGPRRVGASPAGDAAPPSKSGARRSPFDLADEEPTQVRARAAGGAPRLGEPPAPLAAEPAAPRPPRGADPTGKTRTLAGKAAAGPGGADAAPPNRTRPPRGETGPAEGGERRMSRAEKAARDAKRKRELEASAPELAAAAAAPAVVSPRRVRRGPHPAVLGALAVAVLAAGATAAMFLDVLPNPFAEPAPAPMAARAPRAAKPVGKPAPVAAQAAAAAAPAAQQPAEQPAAEAAPTPEEAVQEPVEVAAVAAERPAAAPAAESDDSEVGDDVDNRRLWLLGMKKLAAEDMKAAEAIARRALARDSSDHHAMEVLAQALIGQDRGKEAVEYARKIVHKRRNRVAYRLILGDALLMIGDQAGARAEWEHALKLEPKNKDARLRLR